MGDWVLRAACKQISEWQQVGYALRIAVNISGREVQEEGLQERWVNTTYHHSCWSWKLPKACWLEEHDKIIDSLNEIKATGIILAIDDFGSGYSSFNYLKNLPVDTLKIDRVFINDLSDDKSGQAIIVGIIALADNLGLETVAEGVETEHQQQLLKALGCKLLQGFLFSKAIPADEFSQQFLASAPNQGVATVETH